MIYITGDKHSRFSEIFTFCYLNNTSRKDTLIILGDSGINYYLDNKDYNLKNSLSYYPITFFCLNGSHEERPENIYGYKTRKFHDGLVYYEKKFPNILFAIDGEIYNFNDKKVLVIGSSYSIDDYYKIAYQYDWLNDKKLDNNTIEKVRKVLKDNNYKVDIILSHTCPYKYVPKDEIEHENEINYSREYFLDEIDNNTFYDEWYCGHFHNDENIKKLKFMYNNISKL